MSWKRSRNTRNSGRQRSSFIFLASLLFLLGLGAGSPAEEKLKEFQDRFDREPHAENKVKLLEKLGVAEFQAADDAEKRGDYTAVGFTFEKFRDNARDAFALLRKQEPDVDKHATGYRKLELQVRRGIREVEETVIVVPDVVRPPLQIVRKDLIDLDDALIALLFPPIARPAAGVAAGTEPKP